MRNPVKVDWMVPKDSWERTRRHVESEYGSVEGYLGRFVESAMKEYSDQDGYQELEEKIDRLVRAAGRTPKDLSKEKKLSNLSSQETTRVTARVDERVKEIFKKAVDEKRTDHSYGVVLAEALRRKRDGGRAGRLEDKVDRIVEDAEAVLSELTPEESGKEQLSTVERRTVVICNRLPEQFTDDELVQEIHDVAGSNGYASDPTVEKYRERVIDRLDYEPHPTAPRDIWVPKEAADELTPDGVPKEVRRPVDLLDREERVRRIQLALGRRATARDGRFKTTATEVREQVFDNEISLSSVSDLLNQVALEDGYTLDKNASRTSVGVNVRGALTDEELADEIRDYVRADTGGLFSSTTETTVDDWSPGPDTSPTSPGDVKNELDTLGDAATDGGGSPKGDDV